jgi:hypothetical protein
MGPRPPDFNEDIVKQSPSFIKWQQLENGQKMKYACREFTKGQANDEERLMRRIMIARRNNIKDHETLKRAREMQGGQEKNNKSTKKQRFTAAAPDEQIVQEMDEPAVVATRSYKAWLELPDGTEFVYNQKYIKGKEGHDWLLKKNIWRRMRYRRENKKLLQDVGARRPDRATAAAKSKGNGESATGAASASGLVDHALLPEDDEEEAYDQKASASAAAATEATAEMDSAAIESALAAGESYVKAENLGRMPVHNPLEAAATSEALDAAAKLAAATASQMEGEQDVAEV